MHLKDAEGIANSVDPDQTSLIWVCTVCPDLSVRKLRNITVSTTVTLITWSIVLYSKPFGINVFLHTRQGFPRLLPILDISVLLEWVYNDLVHDVRMSWIGAEPNISWKRISNGCSVQIENYVTQDNCSASLRKLHDARHLWQNFQSAPQNKYY